MNDNSTSVETTRVNRLSDHDFLLALAYLNQQGETEYGFPPYDWELKFYTSSPLNFYTVSCRGGVMLNCQREGDMVRVIMDGHKLSTGVLRARSTIYIPDSNFPDGTRRVVDEHEFKTLFVSGHGTLASGPQLELLFPYVKGEPGKPFTYDDFTPEQLEGLRGPQGKPLTYDDLTPGQIAELQRPATEAAQLVTSAIDAATATNNAITKAEQTRVEAEQSRAATEQTRVEAEALRVEAEQARAREFAGFAQDIDRASKQCFIDLFNTAAGPCGKYDPDNAPDADHPFLCNELWLTYEEAMLVYEYRVTTHHDFYERCYDPGFASRTKLLRTVLSPIYTQYGETLDLTRFVCYCQNVEILNISTNTSQHFNIGPCDDAFRDCSSLREVHPSLIFTKLPSYGQNAIPFRGCSSLERLFAEFRVNAYLQDCPKLSLASVEYIASHSSAGVTVTVHPDVYAKLTGDTTNAAAAALTADELAQWQEVLGQAVAKNISFATA